MELNRFKQLLESQLGNVKPLLYEQDEEVIVTNHDKDYDYKKAGDKFYFKLKQNPKSSRAKSFKAQGKYINWTESAGAGLESIKKSVYKINPEGNAGGGSSTEPPKPKGAATTDTPKEPEKESGCVWGDCKNGKGRYVFDSGDYYEGDWKDDMYNGKGKYVGSDGRYYEGDWKDDNKNGKGKYVWPDGSYYEGDWKDGDMNGKGKYVWPSGRYYEGDWKDGEMNGIGKIVYKDGSYYEGEFKDKRWDGYGQEYINNKKVFGGFYKGGMRINGTRIFLDNSYYRGSFKDTNELDESIYFGPSTLSKVYPHGFGRSYNVKDDVIFSGKWENGKAKK